MEYTYYKFNDVIGAYLEMPTSDARALLPAPLQPLEPQHCRSVLGVTIFDFHDSLVGSYREAVLAIIVPPLVQPGRPLPKAGLYPFIVGTTTKASRDHAIERWHLPHYMKELDIALGASDGALSAVVSDDGKPVMELTVTEHSYVVHHNLYNSFSTDSSGRYKFSVHMEAEHSEHEEERGSLKLYPHAMTKGLTLSEISTVPFREEWYRKGVQSIEPLETL